MEMSTSTGRKTPPLHVLYAGAVVIKGLRVLLVRQAYVMRSRCGGASRGDSWMRRSSPTSPPVVRRWRRAVSRSCRKAPAPWGACPL